MPLRIQSLSPEQQRFAQAFRKMQLFLGLVLDGGRNNDAFFYFKLCFIIVGYSRLNGCLLPVIPADRICHIVFNPGNQWIRSLEKPTGPTIWAVEFKATSEVSDDHSLLM